MPRIRSLKPEHKQHRKVGRLDDGTYRLWVGLITEADDEGRLVADPEQLRGIVWQYHPSVTAEDVSRRLQTLADAGLIVLYRVTSRPFVATNGQKVARSDQFVAIPSWSDHQKIDRPRPSRLPKPPILRVRERSSKTRRTGAEHSTSARRGSDLIGSDQGSRIESSTRARARVADSMPDARSIRVPISTVAHASGSNGTSESSRTPGLPSVSDTERAALREKQDAALKILAVATGQPIEAIQAMTRAAGVEP